MLHQPHPTGIYNSTSFNSKIGREESKNEKLNYFTKSKELPLNPREETHKWCIDIPQRSCAPAGRHHNQIVISSEFVQN